MCFKSCVIQVVGKYIVNNIHVCIVININRLCRGFTQVYGYFTAFIFTPQPSGLEGYCRHGPGGRAGGRAGGCQTCGTHISVTA